METSNEPKPTKWFRVKSFGWGWTPITWQGWVVTFLYAFALVPDFLKTNAASHSVSDFLITFGLHFVILTTFFLIICYTKGEKPGWHWGEKRASGASQDLEHR